MEVTNPAIVMDGTTVLPEIDLPIIETNEIVTSAERGTNRDARPDPLHLVGRVVVEQAEVSRAIGELEGI